MPISICFSFNDSDISHIEVKKPMSEQTVGNKLLNPLAYLSASMPSISAKMLAISNNHAVRTGVIRSPLNVCASHLYRVVNSTKLERYLSLIICWIIQDEYDKCISTACPAR